MGTEMKEERRRLSAADALWMLWIVALAALALVGVLSVSRGGAQTCEIVYVLRIRDVDPTLVAEGTERLIPVGAEVYNENGTACLGHVEAVTVREDKRVTVTDGVLGFAPKENGVVLEIAVRGEGREREGEGLRIFDVRIAAGGVGGFRLGNYYAARAAVTYVARVEREEE